MVADLIEHDGQTARLAGRIPDSHPYVADKRAPVILVVEFAAQAAGVLIALSKSTDKETLSHPRLGYLASLRDTRLFYPEIHVDQLLEAQVRLDSHMGDLSLVTFTVAADGEPVAEGRLSLSTPS